MTRSAGRWIVLVWAAIVVALVVMAIITVLRPEMPNFPRIAVLLFMSEVASLGLVGAFLVWRQPRNVVGWILWIAAMGIAISVIGDALAFAMGQSASGTPVAWLIWFSSLLLLPSFVAVVTILPLFFPDGRLLSSRWRWLVVFTITALVLGLLPIALAPGFIPDTVVDNPAGTDVATGMALLNTLGTTVAPLIAFPLAVLCLVLRYRRGSSVERQQLKWFAAAAALTVGMLIVAILAPPGYSDVGWVGGIVSITLMPLAIGIAVLRYRLYDLDRIISRTVGWAIVTGALITAFAVLVVGLSGLLASFAQGQTVAVAASTLAAFALFQPVQRRVQGVVDRRFDRARFDAERTASAFADRLRNEVDLSAVTADLANTTGSTLSPAALAVWIREP